MMMAWILGVPAILMAVVLGLSWLEERIVAPVDRATRIGHGS